LGTEVVVVGGAIDVEVVVEVVFAGEGGSSDGFTVVVTMGFMVVTGAGALVVSSSLEHSTASRQSPLQ